MVWRWFGDGLGLFPGRSRTGFEKSKIREFGIEQMIFKWPRMYSNIRKLSKISIKTYIWPWLVCIRQSKLLKEDYHAKIMALFEEDHDLCRGSWSLQKMMIWAEDDDSCRRWWSWQTIMILAACSCQNSMILLGNKEFPFRDHLGTTSGPILAKFRN